VPEHKFWHSMTRRCHTLTRVPSPCLLSLFGSIDQFRKDININRDVVRLGGGGGGGDGDIDRRSSPAGDGNGMYLVGKMPTAHCTITDHRRRSSSSSIFLRAQYLSVWMLVLAGSCQRNPRVTGFGGRGPHFRVLTFGGRVFHVYTTVSRATRNAECCLLLTEYGIENRVECSNGL